MPLTKATYSMISGSPANLRDFGAVGDGVANDAAALQAALNFCKLNKKELFCPAGTYLINTQVTVTSFAGVTIRGEGIANTVFKKTTAGNMLVLDSCQRGGIYNCAFEGSGMTTGDGVVVFSSLGTTVGVMEFVGNQFASFPGRGLLILGTVGNQFSSNLVQDNLFLSNGVLDNVAQHEARYTNDTKWIGNQFGALAFGGPYPPYGCLLFSCSAADYTLNYHWENKVGGYYDGCNYMRYSDNRWETNQNQGALFFNAGFCSLVGNHIHTNSMAGTGVYPGMSMANCYRTTLVGNMYYSFEALIDMQYCLVLDNTCNTITLDSNQFWDYVTGPVSWDVTGFEIRFNNNIPRQFGLDEASTTWVMFNSKGNIAAGSTVYVGPNGSDANEGFVTVAVPRTCAARVIRVNSVAAPGAGKTYTYTLYKNGSPTAFTFTSTGAATFSNSATGSVLYNAGDWLSLKIVTDAGSGVGAFYGTIALDN